MNAIMRSFVMGMLPGAVSRAQFPQAQKEPVAYLYNGVELPNIDEVWTDKRYAYAHISVNDYGVYSLRITAQAIKIGNYNAIPIQYYELINGEWKKQPIDVWSEGIEWGFVWTSHTITNADGTVLLAKSLPTIVYE